MCDATNSEWITVGRPGYVGHRHRKRVGQLNRQFGEENWRISYQWHDSVMDRDAALGHYEDAYYESLKNRPEVLDWLCHTASEVYDIAPSNVESGLDYSRQECSAVHLQDIAVRRCLKRLSRRFEGDHLVQIRGHESEGYRLNPGRVPFHAPEQILKPSLSHGTWWEENSIEDFWQSNKVLQVLANTPEETLREHLFRSLAPAGSARPAIALFGGSFNPVHLGHLRIAQELLDRYEFQRIVFVPNGNNYRKRGLIDEQHRAEMLRLVIQDEPRFVLCDFELQRDSVVYTVETMEHLRRQLNEEYEGYELFNVRGSDTISRMLKWKSLPALLACTQIVPVRPGDDLFGVVGNDSRFRLYSDRFRFMQRDYEDGLSSSQVRESVSRYGSTRFLVPDRVEQYIRDHDLYR